MPEYLIAFNDEWVPDYTDKEMRTKSTSVRALVAEMKEAGVFVFLGGLDNDGPVFNVNMSEAKPLVTDGPFAESKEHLGGFAVVDVPDEQAARWWAEKVADACGWPQEVRRFQARTTPWAETRRRSDAPCRFDRRRGRGTRHRQPHEAERVVV